MSRASLTQHVSGRTMPTTTAVLVKGKILVKSNISTVHHTTYFYYRGTSVSGQ